MRDSLEPAPRLVENVGSGADCFLAIASCRFAGRVTLVVGYFPQCLQALHFAAKVATYVGKLTVNVSVRILELLYEGRMSPRIYVGAESRMRESVVKFKGGRIGGVVSPVHNGFAVYEEGRGREYLLRVRKQLLRRGQF